MGMRTQLLNRVKYFAEHTIFGDKFRSSKEYANLIRTLDSLPDDVNLSPQEMTRFDDSIGYNDMMSPVVLNDRATSVASAIFNQKVSDAVASLPPGSDLTIKNTDDSITRGAKKRAMELYKPGPAPGYKEAGQGALQDSATIANIENAKKQAEAGRELMLMGLSRLQSIDPNKQAELASQAQFSELARASQGATSRGEIEQRAQAVGGIGRGTAKQALKMAERIHGKVGNMLGGMGSGDLQNLSLAHGRDIMGKTTATGYENLGLQAKGIQQTIGRMSSEYQLNKMARDIAERRLQAGNTGLGILDLILPTVGAVGGAFFGPAGSAALGAVGGGISQGIQGAVGSGQSGDAARSTTEDIAAFRKKHGY